MTEVPLAISRSASFEISSLLICILVIDVVPLR
jgi:hypothetical protein